MADPIFKIHDDKTVSVLKGRENAFVKHMDEKGFHGSRLPNGPVGFNDSRYESYSFAEGNWNDVKAAVENWASSL